MSNVLPDNEPCASLRPPRRLATLLSLILVTGLSLATGFAAASTSKDPDKDPQTELALQEAQRLIGSGKRMAAIEQCDQIISAFEAHYAGQRVYCGRTPAETLGVLLKAATEKEKAIAISTKWSDAYFLKGFALQDLKRIGEAKAAMQSALRLAPFNSRYLAELGTIYQLEKDWPKAQATFQEAEDNAKLSPDDMKAYDLGRARRGLGYVFVELGQLDEAEKKYQECLTADANDAAAQRELEYVRQLKAKQSVR